MRTGHILIATALIGAICAALVGIVHADDTLVIYSGRSKSLAEPVIQRFEEATGIRVQVKYGSTAQLAMALQEEGARSPADVFWAQDAGALGALGEAGLLAPLPGELLQHSIPSQREGEHVWAATSGRARVFAYASDRVDAGELPESIMDLTHDHWRGRVGWAPSNASFQVFVTALREMHGDDAAKAWVEAMRANGAEAYANNTALLQALAAGEIDGAITNHYYLLRMRDQDPDYPVEQVFFGPKDAGNLVNYAGAAVLRTSGRHGAAHRFIDFLLQEGAQSYFTDDVFEYPVNGRAAPHQALVPLDELLELAPDVRLEALKDAGGTLGLLREAAVL